VLNIGVFRATPHCMGALVCRKFKTNLFLALKQKLERLSQEIESRFMILPKLFKMFRCVLKREMKAATRNRTDFKSKISLPKLPRSG
jgi:hypothetical protein